MMSEKGNILQDEFGWVSLHRWYYFIPNIEYQNIIFVQKKKKKKKKKLLSNVHFYYYFWMRNIFPKINKLNKRASAITLACSF